MGKINRLTIRDIKELNKKAGQYWFSPNTMRFFKSRVPRDYESLYGNRFFITSERFDYSTPRKYTIREWQGKTKKIETYGEFGQFKTKAQAMRTLKKLVHGEKNFRI